MAMQLTTLAQLKSRAALSTANSRVVLVIDRGHSVWQGSSRLTRVIHLPLMQRRRVHL
jgi:hypothetical protein